jgi:hypothetical protein
MLMLLLSPERTEMSLLLPAYCCALTVEQDELARDEGEEDEECKGWGGEYEYEYEYEELWPKDDKLLLRQVKSVVLLLVAACCVISTTQLWSEEWHSCVHLVLLNSMITAILGSP